MKHWFFCISKAFLPSLVLLGFCLITTGLLYPGFVTLILQVAVHDQANGQIMKQKDEIKGAWLIGQKFTSRDFFVGRGAMADQVERTEIPALLRDASASGVDPHLTIEAALFQVPQISFARGIPEEQVRKIVMDHVEKPLWGFWGRELVNINRLNMALGEVPK